jgi:hypothetical protein
MSRRIARSHARVLGSAGSGDAYGAVTHCHATLIVMRRSICDRPQPVTVETCPAPRLGCTGGAALSGAGILSVLRLDRVETSDLSFSAIRPQYAGCRLKSQDESSPVVLWRWSAGPHRLSGSGDLVPAGGGGTVERRQGPVRSCLRQRCPRPWRPKGPSVCSDSGQGREQRNCQDHGSASGTAPSASKDQSQPARGPRPHPFSAPIAGGQAAADPSPVPLPHGG